jgi:hypothetical protein
VPRGLDRGVRDRLPRPEAIRQHLQKRAGDGLLIRRLT